MPTSHNSGVQAGAMKPIALELQAPSGWSIKTTHDAKYNKVPST